MVTNTRSVLSGRWISGLFRMPRMNATVTVADPAPSPDSDRDGGAGVLRPMKERLGRYTIEQCVGSGGMADVYRAHDNSLGKTVAVKFLKKIALSGDGKARFRQEARAAAALNHPSIVSVLDYAEHEGREFIVYEFVEGKRLDTLIAEGAIPESTIVDIGSQLAGALTHAHEKGILHRDIKPQNIMITPEGRVKILDFGLAKRLGADFVSKTESTKSGTFFETKEGTIVGTVQYMSQEQIAGGAVDARTDIFSLGIVLYEMVTGTNPFQADSTTTTIARIMSPETPALPPGSANISPELQFVIRRCMQKRREDRYPSARMLAEDLGRLRSPQGSGGMALRERDLAVIPRSISKVLTILMQVMYLAIYGVTLFYLGDAVNALLGLTREWVTTDYTRASAIARYLTTLMMITGVCGIAVRMYLIASVGFDDPETGMQYRRLFPFLFLISEVWALSPLMLYPRWRLGLTIICVVLLAYAPIAERNLVRSSYPSRRSGVFRSLS